MTADDKTTLDDQPVERLSRKDFAKKMRHEAYQRAKNFRATDPKQIEMKAKLKQQRREMYQTAKARAKTQKDERRKTTDQKEIQDRTERDAELLKLMMPASKVTAVDKSR